MKWIPPVGEDISANFYYFSHIAKVLPIAHTMLNPIIYGKLAHPSGIALSPTENVLYVAETLMNRVLRVVIHSSGVYHTSVFYQFAGRMGPSALAVASSAMGSSLFSALF